MPESVGKLPAPASPVARSGAGDISERELSRERINLQSTPPPLRSQPAHPKKQLYSVPVNKFTAKVSPSSGHLARIRRCLRDYEEPGTPARPVKIGPKALSMEDLTPTKRIRRERSDLPPVQCAGPQSLMEQEAAAKIARFLLLAVWRRRRDEVRCLRKTLEGQVCCSERLRIQVSTLKSLLDSDNAKVRLAMRELDRLKQLLRDKELEKAVLEREKTALENDVCAAEDRASEMSIGWRNSRNEAEGLRAAGAAAERALRAERAAAHQARADADRAHAKLTATEAELAVKCDVALGAQATAAALRRDRDGVLARLDRLQDELGEERELRLQTSRECGALTGRCAAAAAEAGALGGAVRALQTEVARLDRQLAVTREQLDWWPRPLTKMLGAARGWLRGPVSVPDAVLWTLLPARHGC